MYIITEVNRTGESADYPNMQFLTCYPLGSKNQNHLVKVSLHAQMLLMLMYGSAHFQVPLGFYDGRMSMTVEQTEDSPIKVGHECLCQPAGLLKDRDISWKIIVPDVLAERW